MIFPLVVISHDCVPNISGLSTSQKLADNHFNTPDHAAPYQVFIPAFSPFITWHIVSNMSISFLRTARIVLPSLRPIFSTSSACSSRRFSCLSSVPHSLQLSRPTLLPAIKNGVQEQVRGMKVRSSVKKLCEGCKVCSCILMIQLQADTGRSL